MKNCHSGFIELKTVPIEMCFENAFTAPVPNAFAPSAHLVDGRVEVPQQPTVISTEQTQPLALNCRPSIPEPSIQMPSVQRAESPELIFERLPCSRGGGGEKSVSLPFKKSLRFSKVDLNGQVHNLASDRNYCTFSSTQKQEPSKIAEASVVKIDSVSDAEAKGDAEEKVETPEKPTETETRAIQKVEKTESKSKKKRGKQAEPLPSHIIVQDGTI